MDDDKKDELEQGIKQVYDMLILRERLVEEIKGNFFIPESGEVERLYDQMIEHGMPEELVEIMWQEGNEKRLGYIAEIDERLRELGFGEDSSTED